MSESKFYHFNLRCANCHRRNQLKIPFGTPVSKFTAENTLPACQFCGCHPLTGR